MRSLRVLLVVCLIACFIGPLSAVASASPQHNGSYLTTTDFVWANIQSNVSGTFVELTNQTDSASVVIVPGTDLNFSQMLMYVNSSAVQRVDFTLTVTDNAAPMYSYAVTNVDTAAGNHTYQFLSGTNTTDNFNFTTVHGHTYVIHWHYRCHTVFWNALLTQDDLLLTVSEPVPTADTAVLLHTTAFIFPGGTMPYHAYVFPGTPAQGTVIFTAGDSLWGINQTVLVGATGNVQMLADITMYDGSTNVSYGNFVINMTSGYTNAQFGVHPPTNVIGAYVLQAGHTYTILITYTLYDGATIVATGQFTIAMHEVVPAPFYYNWVLAIVYIAGLFGPAIILGWFVPRYGVMLGVATMSIVIAMLVPAFIVVTFISLVVVGVMLFIGRG